MFVSRQWFVFVCSFRLLERSSCVYIIHTKIFYYHSIKLINNEFSVRSHAIIFAFSLRLGHVKTVCEQMRACTCKCDVVPN